MTTQTRAEHNATTEFNARGHDDESQLDAAIAESFPASDPVSVAQPGSLVANRNGASDNAERLAAIATGAALAILVVAALRIVAPRRGGLPSD